MAQRPPPPEPPRTLGPEARAACAGAVHLNLAGAYLKTGEHADALQQCKLALALDKGSAKAWYRRGKAHLALGQDDEAREALAEARRLAPEDAAVRATLAQVGREEALKAKARKEVFGGLFGAPPPEAGPCSTASAGGGAEAEGGAGEGTGEQGGGGGAALQSGRGARGGGGAAGGAAAADSRLQRFAGWLWGRSS